MLQQANLPNYLYTTDLLNVEHTNFIVFWSDTTRESNPGLPIKTYNLDTTDQN